MIEDSLRISPAPLIDIGVNLANKSYLDDTAEVLARAKAANVSSCILTGTSEVVSEQVLEICAQFSGEFPNMLYATAGVHPHDAKSFGESTASQLKTLAKHPSVIAIGETGLDFNRNFSSPADQEKAFESQLELAAELGLPVFMHERDAHRRQHEILKNYRDHLVDGVIHCFTGDRTSLFNYLDMDLHIGITGWICDERRGLELQRLVHNIPLDRLMIETDAPYLLPRNISPKPDTRRNEPCMLPWVLSGIARHRSETELELANASFNTTRAFFRLKQQAKPLKEIGT